MATPVAFVRQPGAHPHADSESQDRSAPRHGFGQKDHRGFVARHIDEIGLRRHDADCLEFREHLLLRRIDQHSGGAGTRAQALNRLHHVDRLLDEGFPDLLGPLQVLVHPLQNIRVMREGLDTLVPRAVFDLGTFGAVGAQLASGQDHIRRNGGGRQDQRNQGVRVERDRGEEFLQFLRRPVHSHRRRKGEEVGAERG
jgi:hypothetical protein